MPSVVADPLVSVIIPVWRDTPALAALLDRLQPPQDAEVIVVSGANGEEAELDAVGEHATWVRWLTAPVGRGRQMNEGARVARGRWLLFLHADSELPSRWLEVIAAADADLEVVGGSFGLEIGSPCRAARVIEAGVRWRVRWLALPYGDQGIFVRRAVFQTMGGYRELPLMEDVEFVRRLRRRGRLHHSAVRIVTSARRWEQEGWVRRSAENVALLLLFLAGVPARWLARIYYR